MEWLENGNRCNLLLEDISLNERENVKDAGKTSSVVMVGDSSTNKKTGSTELEVVETKMFRFSLGVARLDKIKNEFIRGTAHVRQL